MDYISTKKISPESELKINNPNASKKVYIETYGCQMNVSDSEIVVSILSDHNFTTTDDIKEADLIFVNTCSIRENAEVRIRGRLNVFRQEKKRKPDLIIGVIGCMAERLKEKLLEQEKVVDLVIGPDAYRKLPELIAEAEAGQKAVNVLLSREETYADISPIRYASNGVSAFVSIMRGCDNMCTYCVVPFTRGRERSRDPKSILNEVKQLVVDGFKEVILLGQNVDKYSWEKEDGTKLNFANLLDLTAKVDANLRVRFSTSYPQDMNDEVLHTMAKYKNICKHIHLPVQSGSTKILGLMKRGYSQEWYLNRIEAIKTIIPECSISSDIIVGFCGETEEDHQETLKVMQESEYDFAYMFKYSERPNTYAQRKLKDDVPEEIKTRRLNEIIALQQELSEKAKAKDVGNEYEVLIEGISKKSDEEFYGRTSQNKTVVFPKKDTKKGDLVKVKILRNTSATLIGEIVE
jgi:tRNA-2-methylthio-N6-dimethylallyladenosine synthase